MLRLYDKISSCLKKQLNLIINNFKKRNDV